MNCNFLETEFFYHTHLSSQGESCPNNYEDYLSLVVPLPSSPIEDSTEPVVVTAAEQVSPQGPTHPPPTPLPTISEVIPEPNVVENTVITDPVDTETQEENNTVDGTTGRYLLPFRSTRGIPRKDIHLKR